MDSDERIKVQWPDALLRAHKNGMPIDSLAAATSELPLDDSFGRKDGW